MTGQNKLRTAFTAALCIGGLFLGVRCLLPVALPFLLGIGLALAAEPLIAPLCEKLHWNRVAASALGVTAAVLLSLALVAVLATALVLLIRRFSGVLPQIGYAVEQGMNSLRQWALGLSDRLPENIGQVTSRFTEDLFSDGSALMQEVVSRVPGAATELLSALSKGALVLFTTVLSAYMFSARLPQLKRQCLRRLPESWQRTGLPALRRIRQALGGWLLAQGKLMAVTFAVLAGGFLLLRMEQVLLPAALIALVDAFPVLGTGTVLVPWSFVCLLRGETARGIGLLGIYAVAWLLRSVLEPRILGKELGLDPLVTLISVYAGFRLWGLGGMLLAPLGAMVVTQIVKKEV